MNNAQKERLVQMLEQGAARLREARLPGELAAALERLAGQVDLSCVLAVVALTELKKRNLGRLTAGISCICNAISARTA